MINLDAFIQNVVVICLIKRGGGLIYNMGTLYYNRIQYSDGEKVYVIQSIDKFSRVDDARNYAKKYTDVVIWVLPEAYRNTHYYFKKVTFNGANEVWVRKRCSSLYSVFGEREDLTKIYSPEELSAYNEAIHYYENFKNKS